jgi:hypothetical protein
MSGIGECFSVVALECGVRGWRCGVAFGSDGVWRG